VPALKTGCVHEPRYSARIKSFAYLYPFILIMIMKNLIFFLAATVCSFAYAQPLAYGNFKVGDQEIIYQKVFTADSITPARLEEYYKSLPYVSNVTSSADGVQFEVNDITVDYKKFQFKPMDTPSIIQTGKYSGKVSVVTKDGKYRLTFQSIQLTGDIGYKKITVRDNLTSYACKNSGTVLAQDWCRPNMLGLLDKAFTDKLQYVKKEEW
jgi:hypothetical protein